MAIDVNVHKAVVMVTTKGANEPTFFGFDTVMGAIGFVEQQVTEEGEKFPAIEEAFSPEGYTMSEYTLRILDVETYEDNYGEDAISDEDDE